MSRPGNSPAEFRRAAMHGIVGDVCSEIEVFRETLCNSHPFELERRVDSPATVIRVDCPEVTMRDVDAMFGFQSRRVLPHRVTYNFTIDLGHNCPIHPTLET